jgi:hypothetical protein
VLGEGVGLWATTGELVRAAHADEVRCDPAPEPLEAGDHVAPEVRRGGVGVEEHDRVAFSPSST